MSNDYYTADEAMKILHKSRTTFYREVKAGLIPSEIDEGKRRGMRFPKEAIDIHAQLLNKTEKKTAPVVFVRASNADLWTIFQHARRIHREEDIIPYKKVLEWREVNEEMMMCVKENSRLIASIAFMPLEESTILSLLHGKLQERNIPTWSVKQWTDTNLSIYLANIDLAFSGDLTTDRTRGRFLLKHTIKWATILNRQHDIKNWYGIGVTPEGQSIFERLGFSQIMTLDGGQRKGYVLEDMQTPSTIISKFLKEAEKS